LNDSYIYSLINLLEITYRIDEVLPKNYANVNSGLLFSIDDKQIVTISYFGLNYEGKYVNVCVERFKKKDFVNWIESKIDKKYVNLTQINNTVNYKVS